MDDAPSFLIRDAKVVEAPTEDVLEQLAGHVKALKECNAKIDAKKEELSTLTTEQLRLGRDVIPTLLRSRGLSDIRLKDKTKVIVKEDMSVTVPDEKKQAFMDWLKIRDEMDIVKLLVSFKRMPQSQQDELFALLDGSGFEYEHEEGVHPQTLKKYFKELLGVGIDEDERNIGREDGTFLCPEDVAAICDVFIFFNTKLEEPKASKL
jgi:hypothetical protein